MLCAFVTHPDVVIDPLKPVDEWQLSAAGRLHAESLAAHLPPTTRLVSSTETKARESAQIIARSLGVETSEDPELGEMDRRSTGYLPPAEFDETVEAFFAHPESSARGWERAVDAQSRIERAVRRHAAGGRDEGVVLVAHGGVGALLLASLLGARISRELDQPGMGSFFVFDAEGWSAVSGWTSSDEASIATRER